MGCEDLGKLLGVSISLKWDEAYSLFEELESAGRMDFVVEVLRHQAVFIMN